MNIGHYKGRLTKDPVCEEHEKNNKVTKTVNFQLAVSRMKGQGADFIPCCAFGKNAENLAKYCVKGQEIIVHGSWHTDSYAKNGGTIYTNTCWVSSFEFCGKKADYEPEEEEPFN